MKLARMRLERYMPQRVSDWMESKSVAEQVHSEKLKQIQIKIESSKRELMELGMLFNLNFKAICKWKHFFFQKIFKI